MNDKCINITSQHSTTSV